MKKEAVVLGVVLAVVFMVSGVKAEENMAASAVTDAPAAVATEVGNKICPVSGEKVDSMGTEIIKEEYNGKVVNFCCSMCLKDFKKDPEKFCKIAEAEVLAEKDAMPAAEMKEMPAMGDMHDMHDMHDMEDMKEVAPVVEEKK